jgi:hypothetical protein
VEYHGGFGGVPSRIWWSAIKDLVECHQGFGGLPRLLGLLAFEFYFAVHANLQQAVVPDAYLGGIDQVGTFVIGQYRLGRELAAL